MTLKEARLALGLTQMQLDALAGLRSGNVQDLESGRNGCPSWRTVHKVVTALRKKGLKGITAEDVFPPEQMVTRREAIAR